MDFDYVIVGAGSAGCVLANRLSEDPGTRVCVVEAGGSDRGWRINMPAALAYPLATDRVNWAYETEPEPFMDGRRMHCPRGRVIGGSSSINGMAYVRGHALDYDRWAQSAGLRDWSYAHCLPYFKRAECLDIGGDDYRGDSGPLHVTAGQMANPLQRAWVEAGRQAGYPVTADMNGAQQEGVGRMDMTVHKGERWSAAKAYLSPALKRPNLTLLSRALARRVLFAGRRAVAVEVERGGRTLTLNAAREVILCGGAINSPQLLLLSGVGPAVHLAEHGIAAVHDLPGVGADLQDHLEIYVQYACLQPVSLYSAQHPLRKLLIGVEWLLFRRGLGATSHFEAGGFIRSAAGVEHPDLQFHFLPIAVNYDGSNPQKTHGFQAHVGPMRPKARGRLRLRSADPRAHPSILFNYMGEEQDRREMRAAVRLTREIIAQPAFGPYRGAELSPGPAVETDAEIDAFVRARAESAYHPCSSCRMGDDALAVVDGAARVRGLERLRVVDASIMPSIVSGNLDAPTIMLAEKLADAIRGRAAPARAEVPVWAAPTWETRQRVGTADR
jgi:choline dehydrogenase